MQIIHISLVIEGWEEELHKMTVIAVCTVEWGSVVMEMEVPSS